MFTAGNFKSNLSNCTIICIQKIFILQEYIILDILNIVQYVIHIDAKIILKYFIFCNLKKLITTKY